jgi:hypothetical protein
MGPYPLSSIPFDLGFLLLALALYRGSALLGSILRILKGPPYHWFMTAGATLLLVSVVLHAYASIAVLGPLARTTGADFEPLYRQAMAFKNSSLACLAAAGLFSTLSGLLCYRRMNR